jgi:hypothetical protein
MNTPVLINTYTAGAKVEPCRIVTFDAGGNIVHATGATDKPVGISDARGADEGGRVDVVRVGVAELKLGSAVALGAELAAGVDGQGVTAAATGTQCAGRADRAGAAGDVIPVFVFPIKY